MNIIELFWISLLALISFLSGRFLAEHLGIIGWPLGFFAGGASALLFYKFVLGVLFPDHPLPTCRHQSGEGIHTLTGQCTDKDTIYVCTCGAVYRLTKYTFNEVSVTDELLPYMERKGFSSPWVPSGSESKKM